MTENLPTFDTAVTADDAGFRREVYGDLATRNGLRLASQATFKQLGRIWRRYLVLALEALIG